MSVEQGLGKRGFIYARGDAVIKILGEPALLSARHKWERFRYRLLRHVPFFGRNAYLRYFQYLESREVVVPDERGAKWRVIQVDGSVRYVAENLYARRYDFAYRLDAPAIVPESEAKE